MSALILRFLLIKEKEQKNAAIDARHCTCPRRHDMAAIKLPKKKVHLFPLRVYGKVVILQAEINRGTVR